MEPFKLVEVHDVISLEGLRGIPNPHELIGWGVTSLVNNALGQGVDLATLNIQIFQTHEHDVDYIQINVTGNAPVE